MKQEEKQLLLKDLCGRLPYGVEIQVKEWATLDTELKIGHINRLQNDDIELKPYLRPMSSMTPEEFEEYTKLIKPIVFNKIRVTIASPESFDYLNKKMFDYRGLIPKGLAIEVTEENNPYEIVL